MVVLAHAQNLNPNKSTQSVFVREQKWCARRKKSVTTSFFKEAVHQQIGGDLRRIPIEVSDGQTFDLQKAKQQIKNHQPIDQWTQRRIKWLSKNQNSSNKYNNYISGINDSNDSNITTDGNQNKTNETDSSCGCSLSRRLFDTHLRFLDEGLDYKMVNQEYFPRNVSLSEMVDFLVYRWQTGGESE